MLNHLPTLFGCKNKQFNFLHLIPSIHGEIYGGELCGLHGCINLQLSTSQYFPFIQKYILRISKDKIIRFFLHSLHLFRFFLIFPESLQLIFKHTKYEIELIIKHTYIL
jgi:hypothetical protein